MLLEGQEQPHGLPILVAPCSRSTAMSDHRSKATSSPERIPTSSDVCEHCVLSTVHSQLQHYLLGRAACSPGRSRQGFSS